MTRTQENSLGFCQLGGPSDFQRHIFNRVVVTETRQGLRSER